MRAECTREDEDVFGPVIQGCLDDFDFTLLFEETILFVLPASCLILLALTWRAPELIRARVVVRASLLGLLKSIIYPLIFISQVIFLALTSTNTSANTRATIPVTVIGLLAIVVMGALSYLEHRRSPRPSSLLTLYLLASAPMNAARGRTLWYMPSSNGVLISFLVTVVLMGIALGLELAPKDALVRDEIEKTSPEERRGIVERSLLTWIIPMFAYGYRHTFTSTTLPSVDPMLTKCRIKEAAIADLDQSLFYSLLRLHWRGLLSPILPRACFLGLTLAQAFLVETATALVSKPSTAQYSQKALIGAYVLVYLGLSVTYALYRQNAVRTAAAMRASLTDFIFQRLSHLDSAIELAGSATTLVSADIERIQFGVREIHEIWANLITAVISLYLIERAIGVAMVPALGVSIVSMVAVLLVSLGGSEAQKHWFEATEIRVAQVVKILADFKSIKMMGYTAGLLNSLGAARIHEVQRSQRFRAFVIVVATLAEAATALVPAFGFATYVLLHNSGDGEVLSASLAFGTLTLFSILSSSIGQLVDSIFGTVTAVGCISRIQELCTRHYRLDPRQTNGSAIASHSSVAMGHASAKYEEDGDEIIQKASFDVKPGLIVRVVGPMASGKSTLLKMILGEVRYCTGDVSVEDNIIGYCDQNPWLDHVSIRENITGPAPFDQERYTNTIRICALEPDLENIPGGDACLCFGNGTTLSGGQKARICLARAIYACPRILVLDDCLSGLDANTEHTILENLVGARGYLQEHSITTFLVSSSRKPLPSSIATLSLGPDGPQLTESAPEQPHVPVALPDDSSTLRTATSQEFSEDATETEARLLIEANSENMESYQRSGELALYAMFVRVAGRTGLLVFVFLLSIFVVGITYPQIYIQTWVTQTPAQQHSSIGTLTGIYLGLSALALCAFSAACIQFTLGIAPRMSIKFHSLLAKALLSAPLSFLATTDRGSITNRFAQDLAIIDQEVPLAFIGTVLIILQLLAQCVTLIIGSHYSGIAIPFLLILVYCIQSVYLPTSYQLRLLDLEAKAPIVSLFVRSIEGLATIRAFGWLDHTQIQSRRHIVASQAPFYLLATAQNMLSLVLDLVTAALAIIVISISVGTHEAGIGLALFSIVGLGNSTKLLISQWTELETSLGAMRRINDFAENTPREISSYRSMKPPRDWPSKGVVEFCDVSLAYSDTMPPVISNLTLKIQPGWKIGICGRTGSGKSTLIASILGLVHIQHGSIIIDDEDISLLEPDSLRSSVTVVPQNAVLLRADVRTNLTLGAAEAPSDEEMIVILKEYGLYDRLHERDGLDTLVVDDLLSHGERQIFCIVRALLHKSRLVLLDEPTSRADSSTQQVIDSAVLGGFEGSTVLYVAHRLEILSQFDRVMVMDRGRIAEFGDPRELLLKPDSLFASTFSKAHSQISSPNKS